MARELVLVDPPYERVAPGYEFARQVTNLLGALRGLLLERAESGR